MDQEIDYPVGRAEDAFADMAGVARRLVAAGARLRGSMAGVEFALEPSAATAQAARRMMETRLQLRPL